MTKINVPAVYLFIYFESLSTLSTQDIFRKT